MGIRYVRIAHEARLVKNCFLIHKMYDGLIFVKPNWELVRMPQTKERTRPLLHLIR